MCSYINIWLVTDVWVDMLKKCILFLSVVYVGEIKTTIMHLIILRNYDAFIVYDFYDIITR